MPKGFDTTENCGPRAAPIKVAGYDFVARYLSQSHWKRISPDEVKQLKQRGVAVVLVYEDAPTGADYFSNARGHADALRAAQQAEMIGAPAGTTIYFAVDYDASEAQLAGPITQYFEGVVSGLNSFASAGNPHYRAGIYGSGAACIAISKTGAVTQGWLAQATGWRGHGAYTGWVISQGMPGTAVGMSVDPDYAKGDYGAIPAS